jgi:hypothetical protein
MAINDKEALSFFLDKCEHYRQSEGYLTAHKFFTYAFDLIGENYLNVNFNIFGSSIQELLYKLLLEFTYYAYYINKKSEGLIVSDKLLLDPNSRDYLNLDELENNIKFYIDKLPASKVKIEAEIIEKYYNALNPSIIRFDNSSTKYIMNLRTSNFAIDEDKNYYCKSPDNIIDTINYILELDENLKVISQKKITDLSQYHPFPNGLIRGLEDMILVNTDDGIWGTCTTMDTLPNRGIQLSLCKIEPFNNEYIIKTKRPLAIREEGRAEKNWLPFYEDGILKMVYGYSPFEIITPTESFEIIKKNKGQLFTRVLNNQHCKLDLQRFRGSAAPIPFESGKLIIVHEVSWNEDDSRVYVHRFVYINNKYEITKISYPWYFENHGIEFCRSMCESHTTDSIIITCGLRDEEACCYIISKDTVAGLLFSLY